MSNTQIMLLMGVAIAVLAFYIALRNNIGGARDMFLKYFPSFQKTFTRWKWMGAGAGPGGAPTPSDVAYQEQNALNAAFMKQVMEVVQNAEREVRSQKKVDPMYRIDCKHYGSGAAPSGEGRGLFPGVAAPAASGEKTVEQLNCDRIRIKMKNTSPHPSVFPVAFASFSIKHGAAPY